MLTAPSTNRKRKAHGEACIRARVPTHPGPCIALMFDHSKHCTKGLYCQYNKRFYPADQVAGLFPGATNLHYQPRKGLMQGQTTLYRVTNFHRLPLDLLAVPTVTARSAESTFRGIFFFVHQANFAPTLKFLRDGNSRSFEDVCRIANGLAAFANSAVRNLVSLPRSQAPRRDPMLPEFKDGTLSPASATAYRNRFDICSPPAVARSLANWFCTACFVNIPIWHDEGQQCLPTCESNNPTIREFARHLWDIRLCYYMYAFYPNAQQRPGMFLTKMTRRALGEDAFRLDLRHHVFSHQRMHHFHHIDFPAVRL